MWHARQGLAAESLWGSERGYDRAVQCGMPGRIWLPKAYGGVSGVTIGLCSVACQGVAGCVGVLRE